MKTFFSLILIIITLPSVAQNFGTYLDVRDSAEYSWVKVNQTYWMRQNLNYDVGEGRYCYDNNMEDCEKGGSLYTWEAAKNACPDGWRLPTLEDHKAAKKNLHLLKFFSYNDISYPGRMRENGDFGRKNDYIYLWTADTDKKKTELAAYIFANKSRSGLLVSSSPPGDARSVRCVTTEKWD